MKHIKLETQEVEALADITCDCCGKSCKGFCDYEFAQLSATWGYDSNKDGQSHTSHFCEACYDKIIEFTKAKPNVNYYL